jgi:hypothetical protein
MERSSDTGQAVSRGRHLSKSKPFGKLFTEFLGSLFGEEAANFKFIVQLFMMWFINA